MRRNNTLTKIFVPNLRKVACDFLPSNQVMEEISLPQLTEYAYGFFYRHPKEFRIDAPNCPELYERFQGIEEPSISDDNNIPEPAIIDEKVTELIETHEETIVESEDLDENLENTEEPEITPTSKDIAVLARDTKITTSEIGGAKKVINLILDKFRALFSGIDNNRR